MKYASVHDFADQLQRDGCFPHDLAFVVLRVHPNAGPMPTRVMIVCVHNTIALYIASPCPYDVNITGWKYYKKWEKQIFDKNIPPWIVNAVCYAYCTGFSYLKLSQEEGVFGIG